MIITDPLTILNIRSSSPIIMYTVALLILPALIAASPLNSDYTPLERRVDPPADQITIVSASSSGNGCPQGSVSTTLSPDKTVSLNISPSHMHSP